MRYPVAIDDDIEDDIDISAPVTRSFGGGGGSGGSRDDIFIYVILAVIGGIALGWVVHEFMQRSKRRGGWNRGWGDGGRWGRHRFAPHGDDFFRMRTHRRGVMPYQTKREYYNELDSNHINDIHDVIPRQRMTPLSPGYPAYTEKWNVYRDAYGDIVDVGAGDF